MAQEREGQGTHRHLHRRRRASRRAPKPMEVHAARGRHQALGPRQLGAVRADGQAAARASRARSRSPGRAKYTYDVKLPGMLYGRMIGAAVPAGEIVSIDTSKAEALPGVKAVWTADSKIVRFAGQDVAAVAAVSPEIARDAARLVKVTYKERPFTHELREAMKPDAPLVFDRDREPGGQGRAAQGQRRRARRPRAGGGRGDVEKGFAEAEVVARGHVLLPRPHPLAARDPRRRRLVGGRPAHGLRLDPGRSSPCARASPRRSASTARTCACSASTWAAASAASSAPRRPAARSRWSPAGSRRRPGAPVKLMLDRKQEHLCTGNAPSALMTVKVGAKKDGTHHRRPLHVLGLGRRRAAAPAPRARPARSTARTRTSRPRSTTSSRTPAPRRRCAPPATRRAPSASSRRWTSWPTSSGWTRSSCGRRTRRARSASPSTTSGAKAIGWERRNKKAGDMSTGAGAARGSGLDQASAGSAMANGNWYVFASENSSAQVKVHRDGSVEVITGCQDIGTGYRTAMAVVAAEELGDRARGRHDAARRHRSSPRAPAPAAASPPTRWRPAVRLAANEARDEALRARGAAPRRDARGARRREREDLRARRTRRRPSPSSRPRRR